METGLDERFLVGVYRTSAVLWAVGAGVFGGLGRESIALGWTIGSGASVGLLRGIEWTVRRFFVPGRMISNRDFIKILAVKLIIIVPFVVGIVLLGGRSFGFIAGFCAGLVLTQSVIVLKVLGAILSER